MGGGGAARAAPASGTATAEAKRMRRNMALGVNDAERAHRAIKGSDGERLTYRRLHSAQSARAV